MGTSKSEKIKLYIVISLSIILLISVYFRFFKRSVPDAKASPPPVQTPVKRMPISSVIRDSQTVDDSIETQINKYAETSLRDIFIPSLPVTGKNEPSGDPVEASIKKDFAIKLKGIIKSKNNAVAIIDGRFLKENDYVGSYRIKKINEKDVVLEQGGLTVRLELSKK